MRRAACLALVACLSACRSFSVSQSPLEGRPYEVHAPPDARGAPMPLVLLLHGYGSTPQKIDAYFGLSRLVELGHFILVEPSGTVDRLGNRYWNATDACCGGAYNTVDDVGYLNAVINEVERRYYVDEQRVFVVGHSNGGFMAYRLACDASTRIAAIVSLSGAGWKDPSRCHPERPVAVLEVHGDADIIVPYAGTDDIPAAHDTVAAWAGYDGCTGPLVDSGARLDLERHLPGDETAVARYDCPADVELWTIHGGAHVPVLWYPLWPVLVWSWLGTHARL